MNQNNNFLQVAIEASKEAEIIFKKYFGKPKGVKEKEHSKFNLVTAADISIEKTIRKIISKKFPHHQILGEEQGLDEKDHGKLKWIIDPIDGTTNFIQGIPFCCISIALWDEKGPLIAVVNSPLQGKIYQAQRGKGAKLNGKTMHVSKVKKLGDSIGGFGWNEAYDPNMLNAVHLSEKILRHSRKCRVLGSTTLQMAYVAEGILDFFAVTKMKVWDFAASMLLIQEAGGKVSDWAGKNPDINCSGLITTNGSIQKELYNHLKNR